jgi:hypothetical protein
MIYDFNQRVHLRRDPSQFGRIGTTGQHFNSQDTKQAVFWEHEGADVVTVEPVSDLMSEQEYASTQTMERLYDGVQSMLDEREHHG